MTLPATIEEVDLRDSLQLLLIVLLSTMKIPPHSTALSYETYKKRKTLQQFKTK